MKIKAKNFKLISLKDNCMTLEEKGVGIIDLEVDMDNETIPDTDYNRSIGQFTDNEKIMIENLTGYNFD